MKTRLGLCRSLFDSLAKSKPLRENDAWKQRNAEVWRAMEDMLAAGKVRAIGISNFLPHHLEALLETARAIRL